jgi:hypothetical protein
VISRAAAAVSGSDRARADDLIDQAITDANQADSEWLRADAVINAADALVSWDPAAADRTLADGVALAHTLRKNAFNASCFARAAVVATRRGRNEDAIVLMDEMVDSLRRDPDGVELEKFASILCEQPQPIVAAITPRLLRAILKVGDLLLDRLPAILPLLAKAGGGRSAETLPDYFGEIETALDLIEQVFVG